VPFEDGNGREYSYSQFVLYADDARGDRVLQLSRLAVLLPFSLLLFASVWRWAQAAAGREGAILAVWLTAGCPTLLAHAGVVSDDFACAAAWLAASWTLYRFLNEPGRRTALVFGAALALALACKFTSVLLLPVAASGLAWRLASLPRARRADVLAWSAAAALTAAALTSLLYGWPPGFARYASGLASIYRNLNGDYRTYFLGRFYPRPPRVYYLGALLMKESLPLLVGAAAGLWFLLGRRGADFSARLCLLAPPALLLAAAALDRVGVGVRRILPLVPFLPVLTAVAWSRLSPRLKRPGPWAGALAALQLSTSAAAWPNYLAYFNPASRLAGEPIELLDDSNLDWGQDLKALGAVLKERGIGDGYLCSAGSVDAERYGIRLKHLDAAVLRAHPPGFYVLSAQCLIRARDLFPGMFPPGSELARAGATVYIYRN
jgi:hypothetical protein